MKELKQCLAILLVMSMMLSLIPTTAFAGQNEEGGIAEQSVVEEYILLTENQTVTQTGGDETYVFQPETSGWYHIVAENDSDGQFVLCYEKYIAYTANSGGNDAGNEDGSEWDDNTEGTLTEEEITVWNYIYVSDASEDRVMYLTEGYKYFFNGYFESCWDEEADNASITIYDAAPESLQMISGPTQPSSSYVDCTGMQVQVNYEDGSFFVSECEMMGTAIGLTSFSWVNQYLTIASIDDVEDYNVDDLENGTHRANMYLDMSAYEMDNLELDVTFEKKTIESVELKNLKTEYVYGWLEHITYDYLLVKYEGDENEYRIDSSYVYLEYLVDDGAENTYTKPTDSIDEYVNGANIKIGEEGITATLYINVNGERLDATDEITIVSNPFVSAAMTPKKTIYYAGMGYFNPEHPIWGDSVNPEYFEFVLTRADGTTETIENFWECQYGGKEFLGLSVTDEYGTYNNYQSVDDFIAAGGQTGQQTVYAWIAGYLTEATVTIEENPYDHIVIHQKPTKTQYLLNENTDLSIDGLEIYAYKDAEETEDNYDVYDYSDENGYSDSAISNWDTYFNYWLGGHESIAYLEAGTHTVSVVLLGMETSFEIEVLSSYIDKIEIIETPEKLIYYPSNGSGINEEGIVFDITDLEGNVTRYTYQNNNQDLEVTYGNWWDIVYDLTYDTSEVKWDTPGTYDVTLRYSGAETTFEIVITESPITSFEVIEQPTQTTYYQYDYFPNLKGLVYRITFEDNSVYEGQITYETSWIDCEYNNQYYNVSASWKNFDEEGMPEVGDNTIQFNLLGAKVSIPGYQMLANPIESIEIVKAPTRTEYLWTQDADLYGMQLLITYTDGTSKTVEVDKHTSEYLVDDDYQEYIRSSLYVNGDEGYAEMTINYMNANGWTSFDIDLSEVDKTALELEQVYQVDLDEEHPYRIYSYTPEEDGTYYFHSMSGESAYCHMYIGNDLQYSIYLISPDWIDAEGIELTGGTTYYFVMHNSHYDSVEDVSFVVSTEVYDRSSLEVESIEVIKSYKNTYYDYETEGHVIYAENISLYTSEILVNYTNGWSEVLGRDVMENTYGNTITVHGRTLSVNWKFTEDEDGDEIVTISNDNALVYTYGDIVVEVPVTFNLQSPVECITVVNNPLDDTTLYQYEFDEGFFLNLRGLEFVVSYNDGRKDEAVKVTEDLYYTDNMDVANIIELKEGYCETYVGGRINEDGTKEYFLRIIYMGESVEDTFIPVANPVASIELLENPDKMGFFPYEDAFDVDLYGAKVRLTYTDGTSVVVDVTTHGSTMLVDNAYQAYLKEVVKWVEEKDKYEYFISYMGTEVPLGEFEEYTLADAGAESIRLNETKQVSVNADNKYKVFVFTPTVSGNYVFTSTGSNNLDTCCTLYSAAGKNLAYDDDGAENLHFAMSYNMTAGKTYYLVAQMNSTSNSGSFTCILTQGKYEEVETPDVTRLNITIPDPVAGKELPYRVNFGVTVPELSDDYEYELDSWNTWYNADGRFYGECAEYGTAYRVNMAIMPQDAYEFTSATEVYVNGTRVRTKSVYSDGTLSVYYTFPATDCKVTIPTVDGFDLDQSSNEMEGVVAYGGNYTFQYTATGDENTRLIVKANDKVLTPDENGVYILENVQENISVYVKTEDVETDDESVKIIFHDRSESIFDVIIGFIRECISAIEDGENTLPTLESYVDDNDLFFYGWYMDKDDEFNGRGTRFTSYTTLDEEEYHLYAKWETGKFTYQMNGKTVHYKVLSIDENNRMKVQVGDGSNAVTPATYSLFARLFSNRNTLEIPASMNASDTTLNELGLDLGECEVVAIAPNAFENQTDITSVVIPNTVESIGANAFSGCTSLEEVTIPQSVTQIEEGTFNGCENLSSVVVPEGVTSIGANAFNGCDSLETVVLPDTIEEIDEAAFSTTDEQELKIVCTPELANSGIVNSVVENTNAQVVVTEIVFDSQYDRQDLTIGDNAWTLNAKVNVDSNPTERTVDWTWTETDAAEITESGNSITIKPLVSTDGNNTITLTATDTVSGTNKSMEVHIYPFDILGEDHEGDYLYDITLVNGNTYTYTGAAIKPEIVVKNILTGNIIDARNYTVNYESNINVGTAIIRVDDEVGPEDEDTSRTVNFTITKGNLANATVKLASTSVTYNGGKQEPSVTVTLGGRQLVKGTDYTVNYTNNINAGTASVTVTGINNYTGTSKPISFTIKKASINGAAVSLSSVKYDYDGSEKKPTVTSVKVGNTTLNSKTDYTVTYENNVNAGTAKVVVIGKGNYEGTATEVFTINKVSIAKAIVTLNATNVSYDGSAKQVGVKSVQVNGKTLTANDYTVSYSNNINVGTAMVTIVGKGNYTDTKTANFTITQCDLAKSNASVKLSATSYNYDGKEKRPTATVMIGNKTLSTNDYTVTYANNKNIGTATVTIIGKGSYTGTITTTFTIKAQNGKTFTSGAYKYKVTGDSTVAFAGIKKDTTKKVTVAATVKYGGKTFKVTSIADNALKGKKNVTQVTIGKNVTTIGKSAFENCTKLSKVTIGAAVTTIGDKAFKKCTALKSITIPSKVKTIGKEVFSGCKNLKTITIKSTKLTSVRKNAFKNINSKATIKVPSKKLKAYQKLMKNKGQGKKVKIKK